MSEFELLSPVGDMESVKTALYFGADAVYAGGPFMQLRAANAAFSMQNLTEASEYVHSKGKKIYVTVNSFAQNDEIPLLGDYAKQLYDIGIDALIVSDIGALDTIKKTCPEMEIHISTQANCQNYASANVYYNMGAKRVVLARELTVDEIKKIRDNIPSDMQIEAFVHGAMCMAYSGRCLISSYMTSRSGNRGLCTQPCRWKYYLYEENRKGEFFEIDEENGKTAILSSHDMNMVEHIDELKEAGVFSFKIEGRMKTSYYTATTTNAYRQAIDGEKDFAYLQKELDSINHRPYNTGFYFGEIQKNSYNDGEYIQNCKFVGIILDYKDGIAKVEQRNNFKVGDTLEILSPELKNAEFVVESLKDENNEAVDVAPHAQQILYMNCPYNVKAGDMLRRRN